MLSLVVCSRESDVPLGLKGNIAETIGCEYELIIIDNSNNDYNIFTAYNEGERRAKGDVLCFMHEDVLFQTKGWGERVTKHFENEKLGLLGVIGSHAMMDLPLPWWSYLAGCGQIIQVENGERKFQYYSKISDGDSVEAVSVDGLWFCIRKSLFEKISFDAQSYNGFHCYDCDICMQVLSCGMEVRVACDIIIEHMSKGNANEVFFKNLEIWQRKWHGILPVTRGVTWSDTELEERRFMAEYVMNLERRNKKLEEVYCSKAYRLGKLLLKPMGLFKRK